MYQRMVHLYYTLDFLHLLWCLRRFSIVGHSILMIIHKLITVKITMNRK